MTGDLFQSPAQTLVNTVNTVGVMGKGIALTFKRVYPEMFREYQSLCEAGQLRIGTLFLYRTPNKLVLNVPTKQHWRRPSSPEFIRAGLEQFLAMYESAGIHSIAFPPLGCGNGELDFESAVRPLMEKYLAPLPIPVYIYPPLPKAGRPEHRTSEEIAKWLRAEPRTLAFAELWRDLMTLLASPRELRTLTKDTPFTAEAVRNEGKIRIRAAGKTTVFEVGEIREVWRELRHHGVLTTRSVARRDVSHLLPLLAALPYIEAIQIADSYEKFSFAGNRLWGVQLVPGGRPEERQSELVLTP